MFVYSIFYLVFVLVSQIVASELISDTVFSLEMYHEWLDLDCLMRYSLELEKKVLNKSFCDYGEL